MIPYNTDAPLYHRPIATCVLIGVHCLLFSAVPTKLLQDASVDRMRAINPRWNDADFVAADENENAEQIDVPVRLALRGFTFRLQYGRGIRPTQWFTSPFVHSGFVQLIFNMIALWAFGLVVEGKIGWWRFLLTYAGIGVGHAAITQLLFSFVGSGSSIGPNAAILGLLGLAVVWAPKNNFDVWFGYYFGSYEIPILIYGFIQFAFALLAFSFIGFESSARFSQFLGLAMGMGIGILWIKKKWVDCEGWDLLSVIKGREGKHHENEQVDAEAEQLVRSALPARDRLARRKSGVTAGRSSEALDRASSDVEPEAATSLPDPLVEATHNLEQMIATGNYSVAVQFLTKLRQTGEAPVLSQPFMEKLLRDVLAAKQFGTAVPIMVEHIQRFPANRVPVQLNLAKVLLHLERPKKALSVLKNMQRDNLDDTAKAKRQQLAAHAKKLIAEGVIELSD